MSTNCALKLNKYEEEWFDLLSDKSVWCDKYELYQLIDYMERKNVNINILQISVCLDGSFVLKIDSPTSDYYSYAINKKKEKKNEQLG